MQWLRRKSFAVVAASLAVAALLGGSLGVVTAGVRQTTLTPGFNLVGGPLGGSVAPDAFVACLPAGSWSAVYIWDAPNQTWQHYFGGGVPGYVNASASGGIAQIPQLAGVIIIMNSQVVNPRLKDTNAESCS